MARSCRHDRVGTAVRARRVAVLGSTGSIGTQALDIIDGSEYLELHSILCRSSVKKLLEQRSAMSPALAAAIEPCEDCPGDILTGRGSLRKSIEGADIVLNAIVGSAGLEASLLCMEMGLMLALANKESLVVGGELMREHVGAGMVIPVDSEHSTIFRCLGSEAGGVLGITLTASGGSARDIPLKELHDAPAERILEHPNWDMGARITVDSATMVNKAFEVIEAGWLFGDIPIGVVVHPQSIVHSLVRLSDGSWKALLGEPDMRVPIQYALAYPDLPVLPIGYDRPAEWADLQFKELDGSRYPAYGLVLQAGRDGGTYPAAANAADEVAVEAFLQGRIRFGDIAAVLEEVLAHHSSVSVERVEDVMDADRTARVRAERVVRRLC